MNKSTLSLSPEFRSASDLKDSLIHNEVNQKITRSILNEISSKRLSIADINEKTIRLLKRITSHEQIDKFRRYIDSDIDRKSIQDIIEKTIRSNDTENEDQLRKLAEENGYQYKVASTFRRFGPPIGQSDSDLPTCAELYVGRIPIHLNETKLIRLFLKIDKIWDLRIMLNQNDGHNRGFCFVQYFSDDASNKAVEELNNYEISSGYCITVCKSTANNKLFVGNVPKYKTEEELKQELMTLVDGISKLTVYPPPEVTTERKNRGYCFVYFISQRAALMAKKKLSSSKIRFFNRILNVEWAEDRTDPDYSRPTNVLHIKGIRSNINDEDLRKAFKSYGDVVITRKCLIVFLG